jgi:hypothetical protein
MGNVLAPYSFTFQGGIPQGTDPETYGAALPDVPQGWQLPVGNYVDEQVSMELIFPRPDAETPDWAKHRRHHPSTPYFCPVGCAFGSWPFYFEAITLPTGATIGNYLTVSGDKLVAGVDYGVVRWATPTLGNHSIHIRVWPQGGGDPINVFWTLEVTETGTIFIDPVSGNDSTGTGTFALPFKTIEAWWLGDETDATYSEFQVCYLAGNHNVAADNATTGITAGNWQMNGTVKPLVHYGDAGGVMPVFDMSNTTIIFGILSGTGISGSDCFLGNIDFNGTHVALDDPRQFSFFDFADGDEVYTIGQGGARNTWFNTRHSDAINHTTSGNNSGICWSQNAGTQRRHYWYQSQVDMENIYMDPGATSPTNTNLNGFYLSSTVNWLAENGACTNTKFGRGPYAIKTGAQSLCIRNIDQTLSPVQNMGLMLAGASFVDGGGPYEISYCKSLVTGTDANDVNVLINANFSTYDSENPNHLPVYLIRNNFSRVPATNRSTVDISNGWPVVEIGMIYVSDDILWGATDPTEDGTNFKHYAIALDPMDSSLDLTGAERTANLGVFGAEVAG